VSQRGAERAREIAVRTMKEVERAIGLDNWVRRQYTLGGGILDRYIRLGLSQSYCNFCT
jgi:hypothetical protein